MGKKIAEKNTPSTDQQVEAVIAKAKKLLMKVLSEAGVPESHGYGHALAVHGHLI
jgi:hypothetical protein